MNKHKLNKTALGFVGVIVILFLIGFLWIWAKQGKTDIKEAEVPTTDPSSKFTWEDMAKARKEENRSYPSTNESGVQIQLDEQAPEYEQGCQDTLKNFDIHPNVPLKKVVQAKNRRINNLNDNKNKEKLSFIAKTYTCIYKDNVKPAWVEKQASPTPAAEEKKRNEFYDSGAITSTSASAPCLIKAVIHGTQTVSEGSTIKLRTTACAKINGISVPENTFIYGTCSFEENRVKIIVKNVRIADAIVQTDLQVYDEGDGQTGMYIEGGNLRNAVDEIGSNASASINTGISLIDNAKNSIIRALGGKPKARVISNSKVILKS